MSDDLKKIRVIVENVFETKIVPRRHAETVKAKAAYCRLARTYTIKTLGEIAKEIYLTNHSSPIHLSNKVFDVELAHDVTFEVKFDECIRLIEESGLEVIGSKKAIEKELLLAESMMEKWAKKVPKLKRRLEELIKQKPCQAFNSNGV